MEGRQEPAWQWKQIQYLLDGFVGDIELVEAGEDVEEGQGPSRS